MLDFLSSKAVHDACEGYCPAFLYDQIRNQGLWDHLFQNESGYVQQLLDLAYEHPAVSTTVAVGSLTAGAILALRSIRSQPRAALLDKDLIESVRFDDTQSDIEEASDDTQINTFRFMGDATAIPKMYPAITAILEGMLQEYTQQNETQAEQLQDLLHPDATVGTFRKLYKDVLDLELTDDLELDDVKAEIEEELNEQLADSSTAIQNYRKYIAFVEYQSKNIKVPTFEISRCGKTGQLLVSKDALNSPNMIMFLMELLTKRQSTNYSIYFEELFSAADETGFVEAVENVDSPAEVETNLAAQIINILMHRNPTMGVSVNDEHIVISEENSFLFAKFLAGNKVQAVGGDYHQDLNLKNFSARDWFPSVFGSDSMIDVEQANKIAALNKSGVSTILDKAKMHLTHDYIINIDEQKNVDIILMGPIAGEGASGLVRVCRSLVTDELLAVKILVDADEEALNEARVLEALGEFRGTFKLAGKKQADEKIIMISKFYKGSELFDYVKNKPSQLVSLEIAIKACESIQKMHDSGFVHLDVKPENFMIDDSGDIINVVRIDFGLSLPIEDEQPIYESYDNIVRGTKGLIAPEVDGTGKYADRQKFKDRIYSKAADVYSLGVMLKEDLGIKNNTVTRMCEADHERRIKLPEVIATLKLEYAALQKQAATVEQKRSRKSFGL